MAYAIAIKCVLLLWLRKYITLDCVIYYIMYDHMAVFLPLENIASVIRVYWITFNQSQHSTARIYDHPSYDAIRIVFHQTNRNNTQSCSAMACSANIDLLYAFSWNRYYQIYCNFINLVHLYIKKIYDRTNLNLLFKIFD